MENPEKHWIHRTQDEDEQNKIHNTLCVIYRYAATNTNNINKI